MNNLFHLLNNEICYAIGWTLIHSLWQCTLIALVIAISYAFTKKTSAATRYWINSLGLLSCFMASGITFYLNYYDSVSIEILSTAYITEVSSSAQHTYVQTISDMINQHINQIVMLWLIGFVLYISKYLAEFLYCQHIKNNHYQKPNQQWQHLFNELKNSVGINYNIQLRLSEIVDIPCVIGHFQPVVLLPASLVLGLSISQIKVILLHELGHVRRNDYLISSLQALITLVYFFNPFARWISSKMDEERENACDDIAVSVSGDPLFYANTLKEFAEMKNNHSLAMALTGRNNVLITRIKRLFVRDTSFAKTYGKAITIMAMFLLTIGYSVAGHSEEKQSPKETFSVQIENEPLSKLVSLIEQYCPNSTGKITLKHPNKLISGSFPNLKCSAIEYVIHGMDNNLDAKPTGISINEIDIPLRNLATKIETYCPETKGTFKIKNPDTLVSLKTENSPCSSFASLISNMDISKISNSSTTEKLVNIKLEDRSHKSISAITPAKVAAATPKDENKVESTKNQQAENNDFLLELSINKDLNINDYNEIQFKSIFFGKKLIETKITRDYVYTQKEFDYFNMEFIELLNNNFITTIRNNKLNVLENSLGSKKLSGEVYIHKIIPYRENDPFPYTTGGNYSPDRLFTFRAKFQLGVVLRDVKSGEVVAVLKDQFIYSESKTGISFMSPKRKSRFIDEEIISKIEASIRKTTNGLMAYSRDKKPAAETSSIDDKFVSLDIESLH